MAAHTPALLSQDDSSLMATPYSAMEGSRVIGRRLRDATIAGSYVLLSPLSCRIVDTPPFQRLRYLKQLGLCEFVFPTADHTRFQHSLGVAHRAYDMADRLRRRQPELGLTEQDLLLVELAGLCHDLGHGPFSHTFEAELVPAIANNPRCQWHHEDMSCKMFDHIMQEYCPGALTADEQQRVKDMILCGKHPPKAAWGCKRFLLDIVSNGRSGLDVDKLDYLARDAARAGVTGIATDFAVLLENMKVLQNEICFRQHVALSVLHVFTARASMHEVVYTHPKAKAQEWMVVESLALAAPHLGLTPATLEDPRRFSLLDDTIVRDVERSDSQHPDMVKARALLARWRRRDIYRLAFDMPVPSAALAGWQDASAAEIVVHQAPGARPRLSAEDIRVHNVKVDFSRGPSNPFDNIGFYQDDGTPEPRRLTPQDVSFIMPHTFLMRKVRVYLAKAVEGGCQQRRAHVAALEGACQRWREARFGLPGAPGLLPAVPSPLRPAPAAQLATAACLTPTKRPREGEGDTLAPPGTAPRQERMLPGRARPDSRADDDIISPTASEQAAAQCPPALGGAAPSGRQGRAGPAHQPVSPEARTAAMRHLQFDSEQDAVLQPSQEQ